MKSVLITGFIFFSSFNTFAMSSDLKQCLDQADSTSKKINCFQVETQVLKNTADQVYTEVLQLMNKNLVSTTDLITMQNNWLSNYKAVCSTQVESATDDDGKPLTADQKNLGVEACYYFSTSHQLTTLYVEFGAQNRTGQNRL